MANQLKMALVQDIQTLHEHGFSARRIARELGVHRETVGRYVARSKPASAPSGSTGSRQAGSEGPKPAKAPIGSPSLAAP